MLANFDNSNVLFLEVGQPEAIVMARTVPVILETVQRAARATVGEDTALRQTGDGIHRA